MNEFSWPLFTRWVVSSLLLGGQLQDGVQQHIPTCSQVFWLCRDRGQSSIFILLPKTIRGFRLAVVSLTMASLIILWLPDISRDIWHRYRLYQPLARGFVRAARVGISPYHTSIGWQRHWPQGHIGWDLRRVGIYRH